MSDNLTRLSVNINKIATLRNARGGDTPNVCLAAKYCQEYGAQGITIHPRPDGRHIKYDDARMLRKIVKTEFNIEGYPDKTFIDLVLECQPDQVTLVPDGPDVLTSNRGWDTVSNSEFLGEILKEFRENGIRTSIFIECDKLKIESAAKIGADRVELYTENYAKQFFHNKEKAVAPYVLAAKIALGCGLGVNAGHDLNLDNLEFFARSVNGLQEVSIGHALISDALYFGLENTVQQYLYKLELSKLHYLKNT
tara:strand:+ start:417 stop:1172 length:756 start_codon:yes stop_codon:yes gene_type:complete